ncbi:MAG: cohesin domain-containing protein, partial [Dehalococcoidia bacterium]
MNEKVMREAGSGRKPSVLSLTSVLLLGTAALLGSILWATPAAADSTTISIGSAEAKASGQATVSLKAKAMPQPGMGAFTVDIAYDSAVADAVSCEAGSFFCNVGFAPDKVRCGGFDPNGLTGEVSLCSVTFQAAGQAGQNSALTPKVQEFVDVNGDSISHTVEKGSFKSSAGDSSAGDSSAGDSSVGGTSAGDSSGGG